jgi:hypothetical protein
MEHYADQSHVGRYRGFGIVMKRSAHARRSFRREVTQPECYGECSEAKDQVEQLSNVKECILVSVLLWCSAVVAISLVAIDTICLHDVSLMYTCVESAYGVEGGALGQRTWYT